MKEDYNEKLIDNDEPQDAARDIPEPITDPVKEGQDDLSAPIPIHGKQCAEDELPEFLLPNDDNKGSAVVPGKSGVID